MYVCVCVCVCVERDCGINKRNTSQGNAAEVSNVHMKNKEKRNSASLVNIEMQLIMKTTCLYISTHVQSLRPVYCEPMDCSLPGSSVHGISQAGTLECVAISFSITFTKIALNKMTSYSKSWGRIGSTKTPLYFWCECKMAMSLCKTVRQFLKS